MMDPARVRDGLSRLLGAASVVFIGFWLYGQIGPTLPRSPIFRMGVALLVVGLAALATPSGPLRRHTGGFLLAQAVGTCVWVYGDRVGLVAQWQRLVVALVLAAPLLSVSLPHGHMKRVLDRWRERRKKA
jgi:hypothetical protein